MKNKGLIILTIIFFVLVNTFYYWQVLFGVGAFVPFMILRIIFFILIIAFIRQFIFAINEKFKNKKRFLVLILLLMVIMLTFLFPKGINFSDNNEIRESIVEVIINGKSKDGYA